MRLFLLLLYQLSLWNLLGLHLANAQTPHTVTLHWDDSGYKAGTAYTIYRATGTCPSPFPSTAKLIGPTFLPPGPIVSGATTFTYTDAAVSSPGTYCYVVTATDAGAPESGPSNQAEADIPALVSRPPPTGLTVTIN